MKALYIVISVVLGNKFRSLRKRPTALLIVANTLLRCSSNANLKSNRTFRYFREKIWETLLLKTKGRLFHLFDLWLKIFCWGCLLGSGLKLIFPWKTQSLTFFPSHGLTLLEKSLHREQLKIMLYHKQKVSDWMSYFLINRLCRLRIIIDLE